MEVVTAMCPSPHQHFGEKEWFSPPGPGSFLLRRNSCSFSFTSVLAMAPAKTHTHTHENEDRLHTADGMLDGGGAVAWVAVV